jgi:hypothetical protein
MCCEASLHGSLPRGQPLPLIALCIRSVALRSIRGAIRDNPLSASASMSLSLAATVRTFYGYDVVKRVAVVVSRVDSSPIQQLYTQWREVGVSVATLVAVRSGGSSGIRKSVLSTALARGFEAP